MTVTDTPAAVTAPGSSHLQQAIDLATLNAQNDGGPFGAVVVTAGGAVYEGVNRVTASNDPTAHAEVMAIRAACSAEGTFELRGATLYSSCEPCPMCAAAALWARIETVYFAASRHDAADHDFDDAAFYDFFEGRGGQQVNEAPASIMRIAQLETPNRVAPFQAWSDNHRRTAY